MGSVSKIVEKVISATPFLEEAIAEGLINVSSLARKIKPQVVDLVRKDVKDGAIIMAINRLEPRFKEKTESGVKGMINQLGDIIVRSRLNDYTFENSDTLVGAQSLLLKRVDEEKEAFCTFSQGVYETTIIVSDTLGSDVSNFFKNERRISHMKNLSSVTVKLPSENTEISGLYYFILKRLAWDNVNIVEFISTTNEVTIVVNDDDVDRAFSILMNLKKEK